MQHCRPISASRTLGSLRELQLWLDDSVPDPATAPGRPRHQRAGERLGDRGRPGRGRPPTNGSSVTPPISPSCPMPGSKGARPGDRQPRPATEGPAGRPPAAQQPGGTLRRSGPAPASGLIRAACKAGACQLVIGGAPSPALVASAERVHGGGPGAPRGRRPARTDRECRAAGTRPATSDVLQDMMPGNSGSRLVPARGACRQCTRVAVATTVAQVIALGSVGGLRASSIVMPDGRGTVAAWPSLPGNGQRNSR